MARTTPLVRADNVTWFVDRHEYQFEVGTPAWYAWLEEVSTFAFVSDLVPSRHAKSPDGKVESIGRPTANDMGNCTMPIWVNRTM